MVRALSQVHSSTGRLLQARRSRTSRIRDRLLQQGPITIRDGKVHARGKHALAGNRLSRLKDKEVLAKNAGSGIPSLVLVNSTGKVISSSYAGSQYVGPEKVLADLDAIFAGKASARLAAK